MSKSFCLASFLLAFCTLAACQSAPAPRASAAPAGTPLGDTGVRVSATLQTGGSATVH